MEKYKVYIDDRKITVTSGPGEYMNIQIAAERACEKFYSDNPEETAGFVVVTVEDPLGHVTDVKVRGSLTWKAVHTYMNVKATRMTGRVKAGVAENKRKAAERAAKKRSEA